MYRVLLLHGIGLIAALITSSILPQFTQARSTGAPCSVEFTMTPDYNYHGQSQIFNDTHLPPFSFDVFNPDGIATMNYMRGLIYTVRIAAKDPLIPIKGFQIQARMGTLSGDTGYFAAGNFLPSKDWALQGVKLQDCKRGQTSCATHTNANPKHYIYVNWQTPDSEGPIQFMVTIVAKQDVFWTNWKPVSGLLLPGSDMKAELDEISKPRLFFGNLVEQTYLDPIQRNHLTKPRARCSPSPCANNATCDKDIGYLCLCNPGFRGKFCHVHDHCKSRPCLNGGYCVFDEQAGYNCECPVQKSGKHCESDCPSYLCENSGICNIDADGRYECICPPNFYGERCEFEENKCTNNPCKNGGTCKLDQEQEYLCSCPTGYTGGHCQRPCRDVYGACLQWSYERDCFSSRKLTDFFDINCPVTCSQCLPEENRKWSSPPLPQTLEIYGFLVGSWQLLSRTKRRVPLGFSRDGLYEERIDFKLTRAPMFGNPSINFTSLATNIFDRSDVQEQQGYLSLEQRSWPDYRLSFQTIDNNGVVIYEDGRFKEEGVLELNSVHILSTDPDLVSQVPKLIKRRYTINKKNNLEIYVNMHQKDGNLDIFTLEYGKLVTLANYNI